MAANVEKTSRILELVVAVSTALWLAVAPPAFGDLSHIVGDADSAVANDTNYADAAKKTLAAGSNVLFLSDLHLSTTTDATGNQVIDRNSPSGKRFEAFKQWLRQNPGRITQVVWLGDNIDGPKGPKDYAKRVDLTELAVREVAEAAKLPVGASNDSRKANHIFVTGNHDIATDAAAYKLAQDAFNARKAKYDADMAAWTRGEIPSAPPAFLEKKPNREDFVDAVTTQKMLDRWATLGLVATKHPEETTKLVLKGFDRPEFGRRNKVLLSHYPIKVGGERQVVGSTDPVAPPGRLVADERLSDYGGEDVFARAFGDIHTPRRIEKPILRHEDGRIVRSSNPNDYDRTYLLFDPGTLGSETRGAVPQPDGSLVKLDPSFGVLNPDNGFFHFKVGETVEPYVLPPSQRSFGLPTGPFVNDAAKAKAFDKGYGPVLPQEYGFNLGGDKSKSVAQRVAVCINRVNNFAF